MKALILFTEFVLVSVFFGIALETENYFAAVISILFLISVVVDSLLMDYKETEDNG
jgi:hypothetical protein